MAKQSEVNSLKTSVSNGKSLIASAITGKGVSTSSTATFQTMANNINRIVQTTGLPITAGSLNYHLEKRVSTNDTFDLSSYNTIAFVESPHEFQRYNKYNFYFSIKSSGTYKFSFNIGTAENGSGSVTKVAGTINFDIAYYGTPVSFNTSTRILTSNRNGNVAYLTK